MFQIWARSPSQSYECIAGDISTNIMEDTVPSYERWLPKEGSETSFVPGLGSDMRSAAYILQAVDILSETVGTVHVGLGVFRLKEISGIESKSGGIRSQPLFPGLEHFPLQPSNGRSPRNMVLDDDGRIGRSIFTAPDMIGDCSEEEAASSIRTESSIDEDEWVSEEVSTDQKCILQGHANVVSAQQRVFQLGPVKFWVMRTPDSTESALLGSEDFCNLRPLQRLDMVSAFVLSIMLIVSYNLHWARSRSAVLRGFDMSAFILALVAFLVSSRF